MFIDIAEAVAIDRDSEMSAAVCVKVVCTLSACVDICAEVESDVSPVISFVVATFDEGDGTEWGSLKLSFVVELFEGVDLSDFSDLDKSRISPLFILSTFKKCI